MGICKPSKPAGTGAEGKSEAQDMGTTTTRVLNLIDPLNVFHKPSDSDQDGKEFPKRLKNIFAKPLEMMEDFIAPVHSKTDEQREFIKDALQGNFVFAQLGESELKSLVEAFELDKACAGTKIIKQGDMGDYFYVIEKGVVEFEVGSKKVGKATDGGSFGELALLYNCPRAATCIAATDCQLWRVDQTTFRKILAAHQMKEDNETVRNLKNVSIFKELDMAQLRKIASTLTETRCKAGDVIVKKGTEGNVFYVIKTGKVVVTDIGVGQSEYSDQTLGPGDYFGERALTTGEARAANVTASSDCVLWCMSRDDFVKVLGPLEDLIRKSNNKYKLMGIPIISKANLSNVDIERLANLLEENNFPKDHKFYSIDDMIEPALYLIVQGSVSCQANNGDTFTLGKGEYFGDETFADKRREVPAKFTITALTDLKTEILTLSAVQIALRKLTGTKDSVAVHLDPTLTLDNLKKYRILGAGTFGQVWLVSDKRNDRAYAMKIQSKHQILEYDQQEGVIREKQIMEQISHPFIIKMVNAFQDDKFLYMILKLYQGGELFGIIHAGLENGLEQHKATFYAAGVLEGLSYMHRRKIIYRDLKPENVLIDSKGYCVIVDLGFAKVVEDKTFTLCGTPLYLAPEVILQRGHDKSADIWSLGVLIFELMLGYTPFYKSGIDQQTLFKNICKGRYTMPSSLSTTSSELIEHILVVRPTQRLGCLAGGNEDIKTHPWFKDVDFEKLNKRLLKAPWVPKLKDPLDVSNFDSWDHVAHDFDDTPTLSPSNQKLFEGF